MKVSVVIPAFNEEKFIAKTLQAVLAQDYKDFEVIVVDNASTDKTSEIVSGFKNVTLIHESRKGLLWAREAGRRVATGDIIVNTDADCIPETDWLTRGVSYFKSKDVVALTGPCYFYDAGPVFIKSTLTFQKIVYPFFNWLFQLFGVGAVLIGGNSFIRASALKAVGGYNTSILFYGEDTDTAKRVAQQGKVLYIRSMTNKTSSRRFVAEGTWQTLFLYIFNFFWVTFVKNPQRRIAHHAKELFSEINK